MGAIFPNFQKTTGKTSFPFSPLVTRLDGIRILKFRAKIALFVYLKAEIKKKYSCHIWSNLRFFKFQSFVQKWKILKLGTNIKIPFGCFSSSFQNYCHIWKQCVIPKFRAKIKIIKFGTKKTLCWCFGPQFWKLLSHVKSAFSNSSYCKVWCKNENS